MKRLRITVLGAWCAILMFPTLIVGGVLLSSSGASDLLPETGKPGRAWLVAVASDTGFAGGGWLLILMGYLALVAFVGFYYALRHAGQVMVVAPVLGVAGMVLVQVSHLIPIGMAYELAPAYVAGGADSATLGSVSDTFAAIALVVNAAGDALVWGVTVPLYAWAVLATHVVPRWIGWLGFVVAVFAGWLGLLTPVSSVLEALSNIGFLAFFVFMLSMGVALLRRRSHPGEDRPAGAEDLAPLVPTTSRPACRCADVLDAADCGVPLHREGSQSATNCDRCVRVAAQERGEGSSVGNQHLIGQRLSTLPRDGA
jgi:hypothetical protein